MKKLFTLAGIVGISATALGIAVKNKKEIEELGAITRGNTMNISMMSRDKAGYDYVNGLIDRVLDRIEKIMIKGE